MYEICTRRLLTVEEQDGQRVGSAFDFGIFPERESRIDIGPSGGLIRTLGVVVVIKT